jgi:hypothetical protein
MAGPMRADARKQLEIRPDAEGDDGDDGQEEQHADQRTAAGADGKFQVAEEEGSHPHTP